MIFKSLLTVLLLHLNFIVGCAQPKEVIDTSKIDITSVIDSMKNLNKLDKNKESIEYGDYILNRLLNQSYPVDTNSALIIKLIGNAYYQSGNYQKANEQYNQVLKIYQKLEDVPNEKMATIFYNKGSINFKLNNIDSAEIYLKSALALRQNAANPNNTLIGQSIMSIAAISHARNKFDHALIRYDSAYTIFMSLGDSNLHQLANLHLNRGYVYNRLGNTDLAIKDFESNLRILKLHSKSKSYILYSQCKILSMLGELNKFDKCKPYLDTILQTINSPNTISPATLANVLYDLGSYFREIGHYQKSNEFYESAILGYKEISDSIYATAINKASFNIANNTSSLGDYITSNKNFKKHLREQLKSPYKDHLFVTLFYQGISNNYYQLKDYEKARLYLDSSLIIINKDIPEEVNRSNRIWVNTMESSILQKEGNYHQALKILDGLKKTYKAKKMNSHSKLADIYINYGDIYSEINSLDSALYYYDLALYIDTSLFDKTNISIAIDRFKIAEILIKQNKHQLAEDQLAASLKIFNTDTSLAPNPLTAWTQYLLGVIYTHKNQLLLARQKLNASLNNFRKFYEFTNSQPHLAFVFAQMGIIEYKLDNKNAAFSYFDSTLHYTIKLQSSPSEIAAREFQFENNSFAGQIIAMLLPDQEKVFPKEKIYEIIEANKSNFLLQSITKSKAIRVAGVPDSILIQEEILNQSISSINVQLNKLFSKGFDRQNNIVNDLYNEKNLVVLEKRELVHTLEANYPKYYELKYNTRPVNLATIQQFLNKNQQSMINYFVGDSSIFIYLITSDTTIITSSELDFNLFDTINNFRNSIVKAHKISSGSEYKRLTNQYITSSTLLYQKLISPVQQFLDSNLVIIPHALLGYIPFELLLSYTPEEKNTFHKFPYLIKKHNISYNYSATLYAEFENKKNNENIKKEVLSFSPFSDPELSAQTDFAFLPYSKPAAILTQELNGGKYYLDMEACRNKFVKESNNYQGLILNTHMELNDLNNDFSFIALGKKEADKSFSVDSFYLTEVYNLKLDNKYVVLSACNTGMGKLRKGEGINSMAKAFAYAGAQSVFPTLWSVEDKSTTELTNGFQLYLKQGFRKDAALRKAKLDCIIRSKLCH